MGYYNNLLILEMENPDQYHPTGCNCALCQWRRSQQREQQRLQEKYGAWYSVMVWQWERETKRHCSQCQKDDPGLYYFNDRDRSALYCKACHDQKRHEEK